MSKRTEKESLLIQVKGQDPPGAPSALFSNFLSISRVSTDVQFEFVFLDLNQVALILQGHNAKEIATPVYATGQTVAKVIMPAASVVQLKDHIDKLMLEIQKELSQPGENTHVTSDRSASGS